MYLMKLLDMETYLRICPCVLLSELNDRGIVASCEIDMCSAISMRAMSLASEGPVQSKENTDELNCKKTERNYWHYFQKFTIES